MNTVQSQSEKAAKFAYGLQKLQELKESLQPKLIQIDLRKSTHKEIIELAEKHLPISQELAAYRRRYERRNKTEQDTYFLAVYRRMFMHLLQKVQVIEDVSNCEG